MPLNPEELRKDFPIFMRNRGLVYLDNAATTQKPRQVLKAIMRYYEELNANVHRGLHRLSQRASEIYEEAHNVVAKFIGARDWREVVFTKNATESLNVIAQAIAGKYLSTGDGVVVTIMEHNSGILPWVRLSKLMNLKLRVIGLNSEGQLDYDELGEAIARDTKVVVVTHISNVLGVINDVRRVVREASQVGALVIVDAAQSVPHIPVDVKHLGADVLAFSGHKMLGPTGIGVLYLRKDLGEELDPPVTGGGMVREVRIVDGKVKYEPAELPWKFEAGTPNIAGAVGLMAAIEYLGRLSMENVAEHSKMLASMTVKMLSDVLGDRVVIYGPRNPSERVGIVSFNLTGVNPHLVASYLDSRGIAVRSGYHCAQHLHEYLGARDGSVRASYYIYNTLSDVEALVNALEDMVSELEK